MIEPSEAKSILRELLNSLKWIYTHPNKFFFPAIIGIIIYGLITIFLHFGTVEINFIDSFIFILLTSLLIRYYFNIKISVKIYALKMLALIIFDMGIKLIGMIPFYLTTSGQIEIPAVIFLLLPLLVLFLRSITILSIYSVIIENNKLGLVNGIKIFLNNVLYYFLVSLLIILLGTLFQYIFNIILNNYNVILGRTLSFIDIIIKCLFIIMVIAYKKRKDGNKGTS